MIAQIAIVLSFLSLCTSAYAFYYNTEEKQNKRIKKEKMYIVATRSVLIWEQMQTIIYVKNNKLSLDSYFFPSYLRNIHRLEEALDSAFAVGLFSDLLGTREYALTLYSAFVQCLAHMETLNPQDAGLDEWIKMHFIMGMVRLIDQCNLYSENSLPEDFRSSYLPKINALSEQAWNYIQNPPPKV